MQCDSISLLIACIVGFSMQMHQSTVCCLLCLQAEQQLLDLL